MDRKESKFTKVASLESSDYIRVFGSNSNLAISKPDFFKQIKDETQIFIYPTIELLQAANLVADADWPIYVRVEETEYRLYKITSLAAGANDIPLDNGATATFQEEYSEIGFVVGPSPSVDGAVALFDGETGTQLKNGPVMGAIGKNIASLDSAPDTSFIKINPDNSVSLRNTAQFRTDLSISNVDNTSDANKPISDATQNALDEKVSGPSLSVTDQVALFDGITGKLIKAGQTLAQIFDGWLVQLYNIFPKNIESVPALNAYAPNVGQIVNLTSYILGLGKGGGPLEAKAGVITPNNVTTFASATAGVYFERINYKELTVEDAGAVGDGATNDSVAFVRLADATGGIIRIKDAEYLVGFLNLLSYTKIAIIGERMPTSKIDFTKLENGSILIGQIQMEANDVHFENWGLDSGSARSIVVTDGLVANAKNGQIGNKAYVKNVCSLGLTSAGTTHGILIQGYEHNFMDNIYLARQQFGLVVKGRNAIISNVDADEIRTAAVYPKSDIPSIAGNVADGTVRQVQISNVSHRALAGNTTASATYIHASTAAFSKVQVSNSFQVRGFASVRVQGGGSVSDPTVNNVQVVNCDSDAAQYSLYTDGYIYDLQAKNIKATNPQTGKAVTMGSFTIGWSIDGVHNLITDAAITGTIVMDARGFGSFNNVSVRTIGAEQYVNVAAVDLGQVRTGVVSGSCRINSESNLTGINGATADTNTPILRILPDSAIKLSGRFNITASTNKAFCNIPINTGKQQIFACGAINSSDAYVSVTVRLNDFQLTIEPTHTGYKFIDLSGIIINL